MTLWPSRPALAADFGPLITVWHQGWHDAHAPFLDPAITALRTPDFFAERLGTLGDTLRVAGFPSPLGLCVIEGRTLDQLFVARSARGTGLATALLRDAEARLRENGVTEATLDCVTQNDRATRFYTREGWRRRRETKVPATAVDPPLFIDVIVFGKNL